MGWGCMWLSGLLWIILFALIIWGIIRFTAISQNKGQSGSTNETPLEIIKKRYARGEIGREVFEEMKKDLS